MTEQILFGHIVMLNEDTTEQLREQGFKHLYSDIDLIELAKENAGTEEQADEITTAEEAITALKNWEYTVVRIVR